MFPQDIKRFTGLLFIAFLLAISFLYVFSVKPPFSSPDELGHISRASSLTHGEILLYQDSPEHSSGAVIDNSIDQFAVWFGELMHSHDPAVVKDRIAKMKKLQFNGVSYFHPMPNVGFYFPAIYIPQAVSLALGKSIGLSVYHSYALMNAFTFFLIVFMLWLANRYSEIPIPVYMTMLLPMSLFQIMSPTIDGLSIGLSVLSLSIFFGYLHGRIDKDRIAPALIMFSGLFVLVSSRANLLPMTLIPLWLYFTSKDKKFLIGFACLFVLSIGWTLYNIASVKDLAGSNHIGYSNSDLMVYYAKNPFETIKIIWNTITDPVYIESYKSGLLGAVAWQDARLDNWMYNFFFLVLVAALVLSMRLKNIMVDWKTSAFMFFIFASTTILIFIALLIQWSPFPTGRSIGVQGRYFIIPLIVLFYTLYEGKGVTGLRIIPVIILFLFSSYCIHEALVGRFY